MTQTGKLTTLAKPDNLPLIQPLQEAGHHVGTKMSSKEKVKVEAFDHVLNQELQQTHQFQDNPLVKIAVSYMDRWSQNEQSTNVVKSALNPQLRDLMNLQKSTNRLSLHTQAVEKIAEAFTTSLKTLQKAAGG